MVELRKALCPEVVTEPSDLLLELPEGFFDREPCGIEAYYCQRIQACVSAYKNGPFATVTDKHEPQFPVQFLTPQQVKAVIGNSFLDTVHHHGCFGKEALLGEKFRKFDAFPFSWRTSFRPGLAAGVPVGIAVGLCLRDHHDEILAGLPQLAV